VYNTCLSNIGGDIGALPVLRKIVDNGKLCYGLVLAKRNEDKWFSDLGVCENPLQKKLVGLIATC
jgi:hypothetical protein